MRLFVAVNFDEPFKKAVLSYQAALKRSAQSGNFTHPANLHMTLAFIGEMRDSAAALRAVKSIAFEPFPLKLRGSGRFGTLHWLGVESERKAEALAAAVRDALRKENVPFDPKPFKPHITLAREVEGTIQNLPIPQATMTVSRISLMKSERLNGKLTYTEIK